jgi:hypothetical protein
MLDHKMVEASPKESPDPSNGYRELAINAEKNMSDHLHGEPPIT